MHRWSGFRSLALLLLILIWTSPLHARQAQGCIACHTDVLDLSRNAREQGLSPDSGLEVLIHPSFLLDDPHGRLACTFCHGGDARAESREAAHRGLVPDPASPGSSPPSCIPEYVRPAAEVPPTACALCHPDISRQVSSSAHPEHRRCGSCHVRHQDRGFLAGHRFVSHTSSCLDCHETDHLAPVDIHLAKGFTCIDCHTGSALHGQLAPPGQSCASCHGDPAQVTGEGPPAERHAFHTLHPELGCRTCHDAATGDTSGSPTHRIQLPTRQASRCESCHLNTDTTDVKLHEGLLPAADTHLRTHSCESCHDPARRDSPADCRACHDDNAAFNRDHPWLPATTRHFSEARCLTCHDGSGRARAADCAACHEAGDEALVHEHRWLPQEDLHHQALTCNECHRPDMHTLAPGCRTCHSTDSVLTGNHVPWYTRRPWIYTNALLMEDGTYLMGGNRIPGLDLGCAVLVVIAFIGCAIHALLRLLGALLRR